MEPTYQILFMPDFPVWATAGVWINLFLFNIYQLRAFKNYGFISMYVCRIFYYLIWHILWGHFRLDVLF